MTTTATKTETIDRVMYLSQRCEEYALVFAERRRGFHEFTVTEAQMLAAGDRLTETRRELRDLLVVSVR